VGRETHHRLYHKVSLTTIYPDEPAAPEVSVDALGRSLWRAVRRAGAGVLTW